MRIFMPHQANLFSTVTRDAFIRTVAFVPPNLILARLAFTYDHTGLGYFWIAAVITQIAAAKLCFILMKRRAQLVRVNRLIVIVSAISTSLLAWHYLVGGNEELLNLSGFPARCACIILSGIYMTLLSNVRIPALQQHISRLKCQRLLNPAKGERFYFAAVGTGTILSGMVYVTLGYLLSGSRVPFYHSFNMVIGIMLLVVTIKRLYILTTQLRAMRKISELQSTEC